MKRTVYFRTNPDGSLHVEPDGAIRCCADDPDDENWTGVEVDLPDPRGEFVLMNGFGYVEVDRGGHPIMDTDGTPMIYGSLATLYDDYGDKITPRRVKWTLEPADEPRPHTDAIARAQALANKCPICAAVAGHPHDEDAHDRAREIALRKAREEALRAITDYGRAKL